MEQENFKKKPWPMPGGYFFRARYTTLAPVIGKVLSIDYPIIRYRPIAWIPDDRSDYYNVPARTTDILAVSEILFHKMFLSEPPDLEFLRLFGFEINTSEEVE